MNTPPRASPWLLVALSLGLNMFLLLVLCTVVLTGPADGPAPRPEKHQALRVLPYEATLEAWRRRHDAALDAALVAARRASVLSAIDKALAAPASGEQR